MTANTCAGPTVVESATSLAISGDKLTASGSDFTITITGAEAQVDEGVIKQGGTVIGTFAYRADNEELQVNETVIVGAVPGVSGGTTEVCSQTFRWSQAL
jgi:hypothetical protein